MVSFHECSISGYTFAKDLILKELTSVAEPVAAGPCPQSLIRIANQYKLAVLVGLFELFHDGKI